MGAGGESSVLRRRFWRRVRLMGLAGALVAVLLCLSGCGLTESRSCTLIGCESGLTLVLAEPLPEVFPIEVRLRGERPAGVRRLVSERPDCEPSPCRQGSIVVRLS